MYNYSSTSTTSINSPSLAIKISKNRAASLLSPIFGRFPFGRKEKELAILGDRIITGISDDGKMEYQRSTEKRKPDSQAIKSTKSKTSLLRRISTPTPSNLRSPAVRHPFKINSHSEIYTTFSKSSPDLNQAEGLYQPWPTPLNSSSVLESGL